MGVCRFPFSFHLADDNRAWTKCTWRNNFLEEIKIVLGYCLHPLKKVPRKRTIIFGQEDSITYRLYILYVYSLSPWTGTWKAKYSFMRRIGGHKKCTCKYNDYNILTDNHFYIQSKEWKHVLCLFYRLLCSSISNSEMVTISCWNESSKICSSRAVTL